MTREAFRQQLADDVRDERIVLKLLQVDLADAVGVSESTVSRWESGVGSPGLYEAKLLRRFLRRSAEAQGLTAERVQELIRDLRASHDVPRTDRNEMRATRCVPEAV